MRYKQFCGRKRNETGIIYILPKCLPNNSSKSGPMMRECLELFILAADNGRKRWIFAMKGILCCRQFRKKHDLRIFMWIKKRRLFNKWRKILRTWLTALTSKATPYILPIKIKPSVDEKAVHSWNPAWQERDWLLHPRTVYLVPRSAKFFIWTGKALVTLVLDRFVLTLIIDEMANSLFRKFLCYFLLSDQAEEWFRLYIMKMWKGEKYQWKK